ncbi:VanZ family protein [Nocardioides seonyuensis]|uniref:VanZ family protein n=1 Tax=Nocardioides seonyuensis TaxID=2518371 RepID=A0A4P7IDA8_9ACTN|nr:VanZ family protein [Nocardioides seonyuensis]QBX55116.1 VanZ family protein [Nocardioides seonyuensis]
MITTFLVTHPWITTVAFATAVVVGPLLGYMLAVRPRVAMWLGGASLLPVAALTFIPASRDLRMGCAVEWDFPTFGAVELMANVVLFVPPVLLLGVAIRRPWVVWLVASVVSCLIEATQALVPALGRSCSTNDWLANTLGAALGAALAALAIRWDRWR